jgi:hypothetical protein
MGGPFPIQTQPARPPRPESFHLRSLRFLLSISYLAVQLNGPMNEAETQRLALDALKKSLLHRALPIQEIYLPLPPFPCKTTSSCEDLFLS